MDGAIKKELILEGLCCSNCAAKIERDVNKLEGVGQAFLDFVSKTLTVELGNGVDSQAVMAQTQSIIKKHEPDIVVKEKAVAVPGRKVLYLSGLGCADCARKIEEQVGQIPGVKTAVMDFVGQKLTIEAINKQDLSDILDHAKEIALRIEGGLSISTTAPKEATGNQGKTKDVVRKGALILGAVLFAVAVIGTFSMGAELALFLVSYLLVGGEVVFRALRNITRGQVFDENFLMSVATIGAFAIGEYPEGVAVMLFYQVGEFFQGLAVNRSRKSIAELMDIRPDFANLKMGEQLRKVSPDEVNIGDWIVVKPGEKIPLDGLVLEGRSALDTSALTGESLPRDVEAGSFVLSGSINKSGLLTIEVTKEFSESTISKILDLVQNASSKKAPTENFITKFARYYTPLVVVAAAGLALIPPLLIPGAVFADWLNRALVFLVVSCPCALVVSIPLSFFGGIGGASKNGILIKGSNYLEALNNVDTVVFDKTGTLTKGIFNVTAIKNADWLEKEDLLQYAAYAESHSNHPIALSIQRAFGKAVDQTLIAQYEEIAGHGVKVAVKDKIVLAGSAKLMEREGISYQTIDSLGTVVYLAVEGRYAGAIVISDEVKPDSRSAIQSLKARGVKNLVMLTGDSRPVGEKIGRDLGLDKVYSELLPHEKVEKLEMLEKEKGRKGKLVFVGDGINDAPVLARADVGVAMGGLGSDAAIEAADVVIMTDEPSKLVTALKIAKRTRNVVWQNIIFALGIKGVVLLLGAGGIATMWEAVFADVGVALIAILNAMRVMKVEKVAAESIPMQ